MIQSNFSQPLQKGLEEDQFLVAGSCQELKFQELKFVVELTMPKIQDRRRSLAHNQSKRSADTTVSVEGRTQSCLYFLGRGLLGAAIGNFLGLFLNLIFLDGIFDGIEGWAPHSLAARYGRLIAPLAGALLTAALACVFGARTIRG